MTLYNGQFSAACLLEFCAPNGATKNRIQFLLFVAADTGCTVTCVQYGLTQVFEISLSTEYLPLPFTSTATDNPITSK